MMKKNLRLTAILFFWLLLWQTAAMAIRNPILLVGPADVLASLLGWLKTSGFWQTLLFSFSRILTGFFCAAAAGTLLGTAAVSVPVIREFLAPLMLLAKSVPVASFVILALIWAGAANLSIFISFLVSLPLFYTATRTGLQSADRKLLELCHVFRVSRLKRIRTVYLPALLPHLLSSADSALGLAVKSGVAAEVIGVPDHSIGEQLYMAKIYLSTADLFAWTFIIILSAWLLEHLLHRLLGAFIPASVSARPADDPARKKEDTP